MENEIILNSVLKCTVENRTTEEVLREQLSEVQKPAYEVVSADINEIRKKHPLEITDQCLKKQITDAKKKEADRTTAHNEFWDLLVGQACDDVLPVMKRRKHSIWKNNAYLSRAADTEVVPTALTHPVVDLEWDLES